MAISRTVLDKSSNLDGTYEICDGRKVYDIDGDSYELKKIIYKGNGFVCYKTDKENIIAKIYDSGWLSNYIYSKVYTLSKSNLKNITNLIFPAKCIYGRDTVFRGYLYEDKEDALPLHRALYKRRSINMYYSSFDRKMLCDICLNILSTVENLHKSNVFLGCVNPGSIWICQNGDVFFSDVEHFQFNNFVSTTINNSFSNGRGHWASMEDELSAIAKLLYSILLPGCEFRKSDSLNRNFERVYPSSRKNMWSSLSDDLQKTFWLVFTKKIKSPGIKKWMKLISDYKNSLTTNQLKIFPDSFIPQKEDRLFSCCECHKKFPIQFLGGKIQNKDYCALCFNKNKIASRPKEKIHKDTFDIQYKQLSEPGNVKIPVCFIIDNYSDDWAFLAAKGIISFLTKEVLTSGGSKKPDKPEVFDSLALSIILAGQKLSFFEYCEIRKTMLDGVKISPGRANIQEALKLADKKTRDYLKLCRECGYDAHRPLTVVFSDKITVNNFDFGLKEISDCEVINPERSNVVGKICEYLFVSSSSLYSDLINYRDYKGITQKTFNGRIDSKEKINKFFYEIDKELEQYYSYGRILTSKEINAYIDSTGNKAFFIEPDVSFDTLLNIVRPHLPYEGSKPHVFLSYSHADEDFAMDLLRKLINSGVRVWYDRGIGMGEDWKKVISKRIGLCTVLLPLLSKSYFNSDICIYEFKEAVRQGKRVAITHLESDKLVDLREEKKRLNIKIKGKDINDLDYKHYKNNPNYCQMFIEKNPDVCN